MKRLSYLLSRRRLFTQASPPGRRRSRSIFIRHLDAGSSNACELAVAALANPYYDFSQYGFQFVPSPRHADLLLITGPMVRSMRDASLRTFFAMPEPRVVITVGDGFDPDGLFAKSYAWLPLPEELAGARLAHIPGDPPAPGQILAALLALDF